MHVDVVECGSADAWTEGWAPSDEQGRHLWRLGRVAVRAGIEALLQGAIRAWVLIYQPTSAKQTIGGTRELRPNRSRSDTSVLRQQRR